MLIKIFIEPAILFVIFCFVYCLFFVLTNYQKVQNNLQNILNFLQGINKNELSYKYDSLNEFMSSNAYTTSIWNDFKKALVFPEKIHNISNTATIENNYSSDILLTVDAAFFFNEDTLINSKINYKLIQAMPTLLTGLGPFFTFLKMAMAFASVNLTIESSQALSGLISNVQIAALCSVFAVGFSLILMILEKILYNKKCKKYYIMIQKEFVRLFDVCSSEQFLLDLLKEVKIQNYEHNKTSDNLPENIAKATSDYVGEKVVPYLENMLYSLNKINEKLGKDSGNDIVDKLF